MIQGVFDFFCAAAEAGCGNGAEGAEAGAATSATGGAAVSTIGGGGGAGGGVVAMGGITGGGGGGGGVTGGCCEISDVFGVEVGPVVGPVLRGSATVAG